MNVKDRIEQIVPNATARHVEGWVRSQYGTPDSMSRNIFRSEVIGCAALAAEEPELSERLAQSFGL